ncbi:MAG: phosphatidylserine/phosphatidylglycerophosphate/cardiolipin synthase family protein [Rhodospirillaceae bacterium]
MISIGWLIAFLPLIALAIFVGANIVTAEKRLRRRPKTLYSSADIDFRRALGVLLGPSILPGNSVRILNNGDETFPAMLEAIKRAQISITFESFIFRDQIGADFCAALTQAAKRGVKVHILLDWIGSRTMDQGLLETTKKAGAQVRIYHELNWYNWRRLNNRTHRKLLIVDGVIGFTGGLGIGQEWTGHAQDPKHWRDTHYEVTGPVVAQMQSVFIDNWIKATGEVLHGDTYFPTLKATGTMDAQMFSSSPEGGSSSMHLMVLLAFAAATKTIDIENSYFVPDALTIQALIAARKRGVRVRVLVPNRHTDAKFGRWASQALYEELLQAGIEIFEYQPTMIHCKIIVVDGRWTSVGSCNFDDRSFRLNDEANLNVFDDGFARRQLEFVEQDFALSRRIVRGRWAQRSLIKRVLEQIAILFRTQL